MRYKSRQQKGNYVGLITSTTVPPTTVPPPPHRTLALTITDTPPPPPHVPFFQGVLPPQAQFVPQTSPQALSTFLLPKQGRVEKKRMIPAGSFPFRLNGTETILQFFYVDDEKHGRRIFVQNNVTQKHLRISGYVTKEFIDRFYTYLGPPIKNEEFYPQFQTLANLKSKFTVTGSWYALYPPNTDKRFNTSKFEKNPRMHWGIHRGNQHIFHHLLLWLGINPTDERKDVSYLLPFLQKLQTNLLKGLMDCPLLWTAMTHFEAYILAKKEKTNIFYTLLDDHLEDVRYRIYKMTPQGKRSYYNLETYFDNPLQNILTQGPNPFQRIQQKRVQQQDQIHLPLLQQGESSTGSRTGSRTGGGGGGGGGSRTEGGGGGGGYTRQQSQTHP